MSDLKKPEKLETSPEKQMLVESSKPVDEPSLDSPKTALKKQSMTLVEEANNTFKELCLTLNNEQSKLLELEERRKKLLEDMMDLKAEIEREKEFCLMDLENESELELDTESADSSYGLTPEEIEMKKQLQQQNRRSIKSSISNESEEQLNAEKRKSSIELAIDIQSRLEHISKQQNNTGSK